MSDAMSVGLDLNHIVRYPFKDLAVGWLGLSIYEQNVLTGNGDEYI